MVHLARREPTVPVAIEAVLGDARLDRVLLPLLEELARHGMALTAYAPIAHGKVFEDATLRRIGERHGKTAAQVALRWLIQQDKVLAIPGSSREEHARTNFEIFDFELSGDEMGEIAQLARPDGRLISPGTAPDWDR